MIIRTLATAAVCVFAHVSSPALADSSDWIDLAAKINPASAVAGDWSKTDDGVRTAAATGSRIAIDYRPPAEYDFRATFTRHDGRHSIALFFVAGGKQAAFEVDAWGQHLAGIQNVGGQSIQQNSTRVNNINLANGRRYTAEVRVRKDRVEVLLDEKLLATYKGNGSDLSVPSVWRMPDSRTLGLGAYEAGTTFHSIEVRPLSSAPQVASTDPPTRPRPVDPPATTPTDPMPRPTPSTSGRKAVLLVIANQDFFYREYADPRAELEAAGIEVKVAATAKTPCRPHPGSGQSGDGVVHPDFALANVNPDDFDAIVFPGGWGSSVYQYAFNGSYDNRVYNGNRTSKTTANRLINTFVEDDKYIGGICHGVSVLAWSRVNGKSLLAGKYSTAPQRTGPSGVYNGSRAQPPSRWNSQVNGARLAEPGSIGDRSTPRDDVAVDGKILTAENDQSAREFGRVLARLLNNQ